MNIYKTFNIPFLVLFILMIIGSICSGVTSASGVSIENQNKNMVILLWITFAFGALIFLISSMFSSYYKKENRVDERNQSIFLSCFGIGIVLISGIGLWGNSYGNEDDKSDFNIRISSCLTTVPVL